jgi:hypothetical protein
VDERPPISFGDHVRIADDQVTRGGGYANLDGTCWGFTTPSVTGVDVIGGRAVDLAFNIHFDDGPEDAWFASHLVSLVDHAPGTTVTIGEARLIRDADGEWYESAGE